MNVNIIPMAGAGQRFIDAGYTLPKALIPISGKPMFLRAIQTLPQADKWIFIVREEHIGKYSIDKIIKANIQNPVILSVEKTTQGQASTCMLAKNHVNPEDTIVISACDYSFSYNKENYNSLLSDKKTDAIVWTLTKNKILIDNPSSFGWMKLKDNSSEITGVSVKKQISDKPFFDHAVTATFTFKKAEDFFSAYELMVKENYRINNEFYVDAIPLFMIKHGKRCVIFDVDTYINFGRPKDLENYIELEKKYKK